MAYKFRYKSTKQDAVNFIRKRELQQLTVEVLIQFV